MFELLSQQGNSELLEFLKSLDQDLLGVAVILTIIGIFGSVITVSVTLIEARKKVKLARLQKETVDDLLSRGYSLEEVERIVFGQSNWDKFCGIFSQKKNHNAPEARTEYRRPVPPQKQTA